jgi:hypothetical protein
LRLIEQEHYSPPRFAEPSDFVEDVQVLFELRTATFLAHDLAKVLPVLEGVDFVDASNVTDTLLNSGVVEFDALAEMRREVQRLTQTAVLLVVATIDSGLEEHLQAMALVDLSGIDFNRVFRLDHPVCLQIGKQVIADGLRRRVCAASQQSQHGRDSAVRGVEAMISAVEPYAHRVWAPAHGVSQQQASANRSPDAVATEQIARLRPEIQKCLTADVIPDVKALAESVTKAFGPCKGKWNQFEPPTF